MSYRTMQFPGMIIDNIKSDGDSVSIDIAYAIIIKNMEDAEQKTRWYGKGTLKVSALVIDSDSMPDLPATVSSADIKNNQITYRDEADIPMNFHGNVGITLTFEDSKKPLKFIGERMEFDVSEHEKYIEHIK